MSAGSSLAALHASQGWCTEIRNEMSQPPKDHHDPNTNDEHHNNVSDESRATLNTDLGSSEATDEAQEERLEILIESDLVVRETLDLGIPRSTLKRNRR
jgi:hypothetical protein